jgi:hypothetical protein
MRVKKVDKIKNNNSNNLNDISINEINDSNTNANKHVSNLNQNEENINIKNSQMAIEENGNSNDNGDTLKIPKKRGRKPKGGKIIKQNINVNNENDVKQNIILHLKCSLSDLNENIFSLGVTYDPNIIENVDGYSFDSKELPYDYINKKNDTKEEITEHINNSNYKFNNTMSLNTLNNEDTLTSDNQVKDIWKKLTELENLLHNNDVSDKKSACFWDTCDFDNPPIYIPKYELNGVYHVYGCFCSPECAVAYLMEENLDTASKFERYHLLNHIYCKIYNYKKNIKPAANPFYTLNKYYGNLTIQEYRKLLKNERLLLIVDKPLTRQLPELHQDNDDFIINSNSIPSASKYRLRRNNNKQTKNDILNEKFGIK